MGITTKRKRLAAGGLILLLSAGVLLAQNHYRAQRYDALLAPCRETIRTNPYSGGLPCYQAALRAYPNDQVLLVETAKNLASLGRFDEARPLAEKAAGEVWFETGDAKRLLEPGALQQWKAAMDQTMQAHTAYVALVHEHGRETMAFQAAYDTEVEPYKTQMREIIRAQVFQEREMMIARGVWDKSILRQPYYLTPKH